MGGIFRRDWRYEFRAVRLLKARSPSRTYDPQMLASRGMSRRLRDHPQGRHHPNPWAAHVLSSDGDWVTFVTPFYPDN